MEEKELRVFELGKLTIEKRAVKRDDGSEEEVDVIVGLAVVFNQLSQNLGWFREQIAPEAFDDCDMSDVVCLKNHDSNLPLGRTQAKSLELEIRTDGLYFVAYPPNTQNAKDTIEEIRSGNIRGCSFQFQVAPGGSDWNQDPETGGEIRTVKKIYKLYDVGPVTFPAYLQTTTDVAKRSFDAHVSERSKLQDRPAVAPLSIYQRKLKLLTINHRTQ
ncbi:HK97 family phage prohead protease [Tellurirhabdus bombi]|uniref:HK97 family phage prohead protease n=1 Tax=Tellurirhabdus bombi TaxID=2907205 RepID=UPI001F34129D|nr:HK97 family phage prohead protease [Tellurirhabdus bombi]